MRHKKGNEPFDQNSYTQKKNYKDLNESDRKAIAAFFALLLEMEIDQQNNVAKEYANAE